MNRLSIFTTCKPMVGLDAIHQDNAIRSWLALEPTPEITIFGEEEGVAAYCERHSYKVRNDRTLTYTRFGKPQVGDLFRLGLTTGYNTDICIYVNADVCLFNDLILACEAIIELDKPVIASGQRLNLDVSHPVYDFANLRLQALNSPAYLPPTGADYFIMAHLASGTTANDWDWKIPYGLGIGHLAWDNFIPWLAVQYASATFIDVTRKVTAIHQNHPESDLSTHPGAQQNHRIIKSIVPPELHATCGLQLPQATVKW